MNHQAGILEENKEKNCFTVVSLWTVSGLEVASFHAAALLSFSISSGDDHNASNVVVHGVPEVSVVLRSSLFTLRLLH